MIDARDKCMLVTKDKLCGLESILVGIPTLVGNDITISQKIKKIFAKQTEAVGITNLINNYSFIFYKGKTSDITSGYITNILNSCYAKISISNLDIEYPIILFSDLSRDFPTVTAFFNPTYLKNLLILF